MKILIITQYFWPENFRINDLACSLKNKGHDITVLTGKPNYPSGKFFSGYGLFRKFHDRYEGIEVIRAPIFPRFNGRFFYLILNYLSFAISASITSLLLLGRKFDVVFVYEPSPITVTLPAILFKKIKKVPVVLWVQDLWPESISATGAIKSKRTIKLVEFLVRYIYKSCDLLLAQSMAFIPSIEKYADGNTAVEYFPNYAEDIYGDITSIDNQLVRTLPQGFLVTFTGNVGAAQDFPTILDAAEELKHNEYIKWVIVGEGRQFTWVKNEVIKRGLNECVYLMGQFPLSDMPSFYSKSDVMLVTLKKDEIFSYTIPGKVQSYMAAGKPIAGCLDGEGKRVIAAAKAGVIASSGDSEQLAKNISYLSKLSPQELAQYGKNALEYNQLNFNKNILIDKLDKTLSEFINR